MDSDSNAASGSRGSSFQPDMLILSDQGEQQTLANTNSGVVQRQRFTTGGRWCMARCPLSKLFGFFRQPRILTGVKSVQIKLYPVQGSSLPIFHSAGWPDAQLFIESFDLYVPKYKPSLEVLSHLTEKMVSRATQQIIWQKCDTWAYPVNSAASTISMPMGSVNSKVDYIICTFQPMAWTSTQLQNKAASYYPGPSATGSALTGNALYQQCNIKSAYITLGSKQVPNLPYGVNLSDPTRIYNTYKDVTNRNNDTMGSQSMLTYEDFFGVTDIQTANTNSLYGGYSCLVFDTRYTEADNADTNSPRNLYFNCTLSSATDVVWNMYVTVFSQQKINISGGGNKSIVLTTA
jgi:hypothetical protein